MKQKLQTINHKPQTTPPPFPALGLADLLSLANAVCGVTAIFAVISSRFGLASFLLILGAVFDFFDGKIARMLKKGTSLGKEIDSLCDLVTFGVAPAVFAYSLFPAVWAIPAYILVVIGGATRLARFNVQSTEGVFFGMPITLNAIIFPLAYWLSLPAIGWPVLCIIVFLLMVSRFKIKKMSA